MNLFKKKSNAETVNKSNLDEPITPISNSELLVEKHSKNYIIFSNSTSKFICINNDYDNIVEFDSYVIFKDVVVLKKNENYSLTFCNFKNLPKKVYEITDFIYCSFETKKNLLVLNTKDNTSIYYEGFILNGCIDIEEHEDLGIFIAKYEDHYELYTYENEKPLFSSKVITIEFSYKSCENINYRTSVIKYERFDNTIGCFLLNHETPLPFFNFLKDKEKELYLNSLEIFTMFENEHYILASDKNNKYFFFPLTTLEYTSKKYNSIKIVNELFFCINGSKVEIIDCNFQVLYKELFSDISNINFTYDKLKNSYILTNKDEPIISLQLYNNKKIYKYKNYFYSIYEFNDSSSTLFNIDTGFFSDDFVKVIKDNVFELKDSYLLGYNNFYFIVTKDINLKKISDLSYIINNEHLLNVIFKFKNLYHCLDSNYITLLQKLDIDKLDSIKITDGNIEFEAYNSFANFKVSGDNITVKICEDLILSIKIDDIKTNINHYILENVTDKFKLALIKYYLK